MAYYKKLIGERVYLSPISTDAIDTYMRWVNDMDVTEGTGIHHKIFSMELEKEALEGISKSGHTFAIIEKETDKLIGTIGFFDESMLNRRAEFGIMIGEKDHWSKGFGAEAIRLLLDFGFNVRNYNNICLHVCSFNKGAIACYEKVGFKRQGVRREIVIRGKHKYDLIYMDMLAEEECP